MAKDGFFVWSGHQHRCFVKIVAFCLCWTTTIFTFYGPPHHYVRKPLLLAENNSESRLTMQFTILKSVKIEQFEGEKTFLHRKDVLYKMCKKRFGLSLHDRQILVPDGFSTYSLRHIMISEEHKLVFCAIPKVASTRWRRFFIRLGRNDPEFDGNIDSWDASLPYLKPLSTFAGIVSEWPAVWKRFEAYKRVIWVRDPFQRLLSAWRNKFHSENRHYWRSVGRSMLKYAQNVNLTTLLFGGPVPLEAFLRYIAASINGTQDVHWAFYHDLCLPCHINYDYIGRLEGGQVEADYVISRTILTNSSSSTAWQNGAHQLNSNFYLKELENMPKGLLETIVDLYQTDFDLFGYSKPLLFE